MREWVTDARARRRAAAITAAILVLLLVLLGRGHGHRAAPVSRNAIRPTLTVPAAPPPAAADPGAVGFAVAFTREWLDSSVPGWPAALKADVTPGLWRLLRYTDPDNVPPATVEPGPPATRMAAADSAIYVVALSDASHVAVTVVRSGDRWLVASILPATAGNR